MKKILLTMAMAAAMSTGAAFGANINRGNLEVEGMMNFNVSSEVTRYTDSTEKTNFYGAAHAQYFVRDWTSVGLEASVATAGVRPIYNSFGPAATQYFMVQDNIAPYIGVSPIVWVKAASTPADLATAARVGVKYFFTNELAFGPALDYTYFWGRDTLPSVSRLSLVATFAAHF